MFKYANEAESNEICANLHLFQELTSEDSKLWFYCVDTLESKVFTEGI